MSKSISAKLHVSDNDTVSQSYNFKVDPSFPCPLLSKTGKNENLLLFIIKKSKECLNETRDPFRVEAYFFWQIMKLFCRQNGNVMQCEVASLLLRNYSMLRKKMRHTETYKAWCLPLVRLLCLNVSDDEQREPVIKMADEFNSRGLTYAAHICYVVVNVELGFRGQFHLIGCDSTMLPFGVKVLKEAIMRTETYEYVLSLTSGLAQPSFQIFKLYNTSRLTLITLYDIALEYCETITRAVMSFPGSFKRSFLKRVLVLSCYLQKKLQQEQEPEWMLELRQLHADKSADAKVNSNTDPEQNVPSASSDAVSESQDMRTGMSHPVMFPDLGMYTDPEELLNLRYTLGDLLGKGGFGAVFEGVRCEDGKQVAIKYVNKNCYNPLFHIPEDLCNLPAEVVLMKMVSQPPCCNNIVELLEWFDLPYQFVMILERPSPCMDLNQFARLQNGRLNEAQTRGVMLQVIRATHHCCERGVLHRDIKAQNLLINTDTMQVKLIDFGCGEVLKDTTYVQYSGTPAFRPPEWVMFKQYNGIPATVWGLGILMYNLLYGEYPFKAEHYIDMGHLKLVPSVSQDCFHLMMWCLELNPELRPTFEDLLQHEWFTDGVQDKV